MTVILWNYHDDDLHDKGKTVEIRIEHLPPTFVKLTQYRIDDEHSNAYEVWKKMGSPQNPTAAQIKELEKSGQLQKFGKPVTLIAKSGLSGAMVTLPRQGVAFLKFSW
jgi:xylan 1,4-beta-xylosidase